MAGVASGLSGLDFPDIRVCWRRGRPFKPLALTDYNPSHRVFVLRFSKPSDALTQLEIDKPVGFTRPVVAIPNFIGQKIDVIANHTVVGHRSPTRNISKFPVLCSKELKIICVTNRNLGATADVASYNNLTDDVQDVKAVNRGEAVFLVVAQ